MQSSLFVCLFICLLATLRKNFRKYLHEIFREGWQWANEQITSSELLRSINRNVMLLQTVPVRRIPQISSQFFSAAQCFGAQGA